MRVERFLGDSAALFAGKTAIISGNERLSYRDLDEASDRLAGALAERGVKRGDRVVVQMENCWRAAVAIFAVLKTGAVLTPVNPSTKAGKLAAILDNCQAVALLTQARLLGQAQQAAAQVPSLSLTVAADCDPADVPAGALRFDDLLEASAAAPRQTGIDLDLALLIYTSGSTGSPKGVMMTHQNVVAAARSVTGYLENAPADIILNVLPISFTYGLYQVLMSAFTGATLLLEKSFAFPQAVLERMMRERVTGFPIVPTMAAMLLQMRDLEPGAFPALRYITNAAAALPPSHVERLRALFPSTRIYSMYGLTECKRCTWLPPEELERRPTSVGIAIPGTEAYVVDDDGHPVPAGTVGELVVRGPHVMKGYWEDPEATARVLRPGPFPWEHVLHTGDLFRADHEGYLYFVGRKDDIIKSRGEKVSPVEVENALYGLDGIVEAAVVGVPDPVLGHAIHAVVVAEAEAGLTEQAVIRHCAVELEDFMVPRSIAFRDRLPKTDSGKIRRRAIQQEFLEAT